ncbi:MAG TPA: molybdopterin-synthase adenylyltransferase MoeB [Chromatiales bacterium]|nr:molybdopterin-synthase adenylyltransferase MoeB [Chromatiales bacterium]
MDDTQLLRYSRQIMLPRFDVEGQQKLLESTALIIGLGGLGSASAMYLAASGIGHLVLVDFDQVELSNLQRQIVHHTDDIDRAKVEPARDTLHRLNPDVTCTLLDHRLQGAELHQQVAAADVVVDGSDNFETRFAVNDACVAARTPLVSGAAIRMEGQVTVFLNDGSGPCYRCLYRDEGELDNRCSENGVLAPVVGIIGSIQATEAIKLLAGMGETLHGRLLLLDALHMEWRTLKLKKDPGCTGCGQPESG